MVCQRVDANRETGVESGSAAGARWWNRVTALLVPTM